MGTEQTAVPVPPQTLRHQPPRPPPGHRPERRGPRPTVAPRARRSAHAYFYPWESRVSSMQTHSPCRKWLPEKLINQRVGFQMRLGELDLPARALFRQSQDRRNCLLGQTSLGGLWEWGPSAGTRRPPAHASIPVLIPLAAPCQHTCPSISPPPASLSPQEPSTSIPVPVPLPAPRQDPCLSLSSCQPHSSITVLIPPPAPWQHPCPCPPSAPGQHPGARSPPRASLAREERLLPGMVGQQQTRCQPLSAARGSSFGAEVPLFLAACNGI